jgi:hypothetical protein
VRCLLHFSPAGTATQRQRAAQPQRVAPSRQAVVAPEEISTAGHYEYPLDGRRVCVHPADEARLRYHLAGMLCCQTRAIRVVSPFLTRIAGSTGEQLLAPRSLFWALTDQLEYDVNDAVCGAHI